MPLSLISNDKQKRSGISRAEIADLYYNCPTDELISIGQRITVQNHGKSILLRGLVEFSNYCDRSCLYCGIRKENDYVKRYRLDKNQILEIVKLGYERGLRTFVLQGGEDSYFSTDYLCEITKGVKDYTGDSAALTLSCGIHSRSQYRELADAGADRYLIRFETANPELHSFIRQNIPLSKRLKAIETLKEEGFQVGSGFMIGLPKETDEDRIDNIMLAGELELGMAGIGPFIPHPDTPLAGSLQHPIELSVRATALLRMVLPKTHIPATTAAGTLDPQGREMMIQAGANVLMPNITPTEAKKNYLLYPGKICLDESGIQCIGCLSIRVKPLDRELSFAKGDTL
ncbi:MAG: [FeFe] hydrogenase H-cluster radical SAM maturase HydE [Spirochaetales bacterium]|nr:[FeFe] hydrogenase H-cluster radical SAM maturase HydE [Spirochaetales bacterium]